MPRDYVFVAPVRDPFDEALLERVLPWVDENYRTIPDREHRAIGGALRAPVAYGIYQIVNGGPDATHDVAAARRDLGYLPRER